MNSKAIIAIIAVALIIVAAVVLMKKDAPTDAADADQPAAQQQADVAKTAKQGKLAVPKIRAAGDNQPADGIKYDSELGTPPDNIRAAKKAMQQELPESAQKFLDAPEIWMSGDHVWRNEQLETVMEDVDLFVRGESLDAGIGDQLRGVVERCHRNHQVLADKQGEGRLTPEVRQNAEARLGDQCNRQTYIALGQNEENFAAFRTFVREQNK